MSNPLSHFLSIQPTLANRWRAIILFGRNSASYKFALAHALLGLGVRGNDVVTLEELAIPFAKHVCRHLAQSPRQGVNTSSKFLETCKKHLAGDLNEQTLLDSAIRLGFVNVIDAFHNLGGTEDHTRFFVDERQTHRGIRVTDEFQQIASSTSSIDLLQEVEARWRLVETAWGLGLNVPLIEHEIGEGRLVASTVMGRIDVTSCRDALNGYQKGHCFYCSRSISVVSGDAALAHVDHFIPFVLSAPLRINLNGVWNLVLACQECNLTKSDLIPRKEFAERLYQRNEFLIVSHHPLRETLMTQTGYESRTRAAFIGSWYAEAVQCRVATWTPQEQGEIII
jgi:5-methylcytosine-specific restriction endonuclease McrA